jgi:translocation and assembly module TamB
MRPAATPAAPAWKLRATLQHVNPALLHSQLAPLPLDGKADVSSQGAAIAFDANVQAARNDASAKNNPLGQLRLRDASATGSWNAEQAGGTLVLSALRVRTDDAELSGQLEAQPAAQGGKGKLTLTAPGLDAQLQGELRQTSGKGDLSLRGRDMAQALRWLQKLPGMPAH